MGRSEDIPEWAANLIMTHTLQFISETLGFIAFMALIGGVVWLI
jgi:hypothetical protein